MIQVVPASRRAITRWARREVAGEDAGREAVGGGVGAGDRLVLAVEGEDRHHRAEDFLARDRHLVGHAGEDRRLHEESALEALDAGAVAAGEEAGALGAALGDEAHDLLALRLRDQRPHLHALVHRVADDDALGAGDKAVEEGVLDAALDEDAGGVRADLAGGIEVAEHRAADRVVEVGVVEDEERRLAAELQRHRLQPGGGRGVDLAAGRHRAGERDLGDGRMRRQRPADRAAALEHGEGAGGKAGFGQDLAELQRAERGQLGGLEDQRVAAGERRRGLPAGDLRGVVPGADAEADAERLAAGVDEIAAEIDRLAGEAGGEPGEPLERVGAGGPVGDQRLGDRLAGVERLELGELAVRGRGSGRRPGAAPARARRAASRTRRRSPRAAAARARSITAAVASCSRAMLSPVAG